MLSGYCSTSYQTRSPTRSEFTCIILSTSCDRDQLAYCSHSKAHNFAQESPIEKIKVPFWSAINLLSGGVLISVLLYCGVSPIYADLVTYIALDFALSPTGKSAKAEYIQLYVQAASLASLTLAAAHRFHLLLPSFIYSVVAPWLHSVQLLIPDCFHSGSCSPIVSALVAAPRLCPLQLLLPDCAWLRLFHLLHLDCVCFSWCFLNCICFSCCSPIMSTSAAASVCLCSHTCSKVWRSCVISLVPHCRNAHIHTTDINKARLTGSGMWPVESDLRWISLELPLDGIPNGAQQPTLVSSCPNSLLVLPLAWKWSLILGLMRSTDPSIRILWGYSMVCDVSLLRSVQV